MSDTLPPHDCEAELVALGCLLLDADTAAPILERDGIGPAHFYDLRHRRIFVACQALRAEGKPVSSPACLARVKDNSATDWRGLLSGAEASTPSAHSVVFYLDKLVDLHRRRVALDVARRIGEAAQREDCGDVLADVQHALESLTRGFNPSGRVVRGIGDLQPRPHDDGDELIRNRYLCRGGGLLLAAPTGIGKSTLAMQLQLSFAAGRDCFGFKPARPLRSLLIQAENDDGDLCELRDGVLRGMDFTAAERDDAFERVQFATVDDVCGTRFLLELPQFLEQTKPDLLWIDPLLSYLGGDVSRQEVVSPWLRNGLNPLLHRHGCACIMVHHTNKPRTGEEKGQWQAGDFAYLGSGSAELANWARAVVAVRSVGSHDVFELVLGKRGSRLGWRSADGAASYSKAIAHAADGSIYWREVSDDELPKSGRPKGSGFAADELLKLLPPEGLLTGDWLTSADKECGISKSTFHRLRKALDKDGRISKSPTSSKWQPVKKS